MSIIVDCTVPCILICARSFWTACNDQSLEIRCPHDWRGAGWDFQKGTIWSTLGNRHPFYGHSNLRWGRNWKLHASVDQSYDQGKDCIAWLATYANYGRRVHSAIGNVQPSTTSDTMHLQLWMLQELWLMQLLMIDTSLQFYVKPALVWCSMCHAVCQSCTGRPNDLMSWCQFSATSCVQTRFRTWNLSHGPRTSLRATFLRLVCETAHSLSNHNILQACHCSLSTNRAEHGWAIPTVPALNWCSNLHALYMRASCVHHANHAVCRVITFSLNEDSILSSRQGMQAHGSCPDHEWS